MDHLNEYALRDAFGSESSRAASPVSEVSSQESQLGNEYLARLRLEIESRHQSISDVEEKIRQISQQISNFDFAGLRKVSDRNTGDIAKILPRLNSLESELRIEKEGNRALNLEVQNLKQELCVAKAKLAEFSDVTHLLKKEIRGLVEALSARVETNKQKINDLNSFSLDFSRRHNLLAKIFFDNQINVDKNRLLNLNHGCLGYQRTRQSKTRNMFLENEGHFLFNFLDLQARHQTEKLIEINYSGDKVFYPAGNENIKRALIFDSLFLSAILRDCFYDSPMNPECGSPPAYSWGSVDYLDSFVKNDFCKNLTQINNKINFLYQNSLGSFSFNYELSKNINFHLYFHFFIEVNQKKILVFSVSKQAHDFSKESIGFHHAIGCKMYLNEYKITGRALESFNQEFNLVLEKYSAPFQISTTQVERNLEKNTNASGAPGVSTLFPPGGQPANHVQPKATPKP